MDIIKKNAARLLFLLVLLVVAAFGIATYVAVTERFDSACDEICKAQRELNGKAVLALDGLKTDSTGVDDAAGRLCAVLESGNGQMQAMLHMQHAEIQEDFSSLMLWASVLMIIFLVFSIYSMYRVDDLVNQSRNSVRTILEQSSKAQKRIDEIDRLFMAESRKLAQQSEREIENLRQAAEASLAGLRSEIDERIAASEKTISDEIDKYNLAVDKKATNVQAQFDELKKSITSFVRLLTSPDSKEF